MSNTTAILKGVLDTALVDPTNAVWGSAEKTQLITWALAELWPRVKRILDPTGTTISLTEGTYFYALPTGVLAVSSVDFINDDNEELGPLMGGTWDIVGDPLLDTGLLRLAPAIVDQYSTSTVRLHGYGRYDGATHLIPDDYIQQIIAVARAEAYRRMVGDRARFKAWLSRQQTQNVSINEAIQMLNEAVQAAERLNAAHMTWQKPVPGRV